MVGFLFGAYGLVSYLLFLATFLYAIAFMGDLPVPKTVNSGKACPVTISLAIDLALLSLFAVQHSLMARPGFKRWWTKIVPTPIERSTFVLFSSLTLALVYMVWRPITQPVWMVRGAGFPILKAMFWMGWVVVLSSTFLLSHFEYYGLRQVYDRLRGRPSAESEFRTPGFYRYVRHPIYLGFVMAFWSTPTMTLGHLIFALAGTAYIVIAIQFEERDLIHEFGDRYRNYRRRVGMLWPKPGASRLTP